VPRVAVFGASWFGARTRNERDSHDHSSQHESIAAGLDAARALDWPIVHVLGHSDYYPRFGFEPASRHDIRTPFACPDEAFMVMPLAPGALHAVCGTARYDPAFDAFA
jgi:predicted N-acetyltransferase YhbS